jgi:ABC-type branched-subunit amino acid transport system ATPase component
MSSSEIRQSQISALLERVRKSNYQKYLSLVRLNKVRGFSGALVSFDFPVTALVGPNGGGKSTVLGAAACAYKAIKPGTFFPKSKVGDTSMAEWSIEYDLIDKTINPTGVTRRSSRFRQLKWVRGDVASREIAYFGIKRTVPAGELPQFKKLMRSSYTHTAPLTALPADACREIEHILGRPVSDFRQTAVGSSDTFHVGQNRGSEYSEFHFGAGESSIIRIVTAIELLPEASFILIEEIENGLHPVATRRLVEYLMSAAERKKIQAIFTTHSDDALSVLPGEAVWSCLEGSTQQGKLSIKALRAISGKVDTALAVFTEDSFAKFIVEGLIREALSDLHDQIEVHAVAGDGNAVKTHNNRKADPTARYRSLAVIDGDSRQVDNNDEGVFRLPGQQPEAEVFKGIHQNLIVTAALLTVALQLIPEKQAIVKQKLDSIASTNRDPHLLFNQVGIELGFISEEIVKGAFVSMWIRGRLTEFKPLIERIRADVDASRREQSGAGNSATRRA